MVDRNWATTLASCNDGCWPATRCRRSSAAQARARRPRQPAEAATPSNYFLCRDPGAGFAPSCLGECAIAARHEPEHRTMWYRKNVGGWERAARLIGGGLMLICGGVAPAMGQAVAPTFAPADSGTHSAASIPDFSGIWAHPSIPG